MYKFIKIADSTNAYDSTNVLITVPNSDTDLSTLLEAFERFLQASGFVINGTIELVEEEDLAYLEEELKIEYLRRQKAEHVLKEIRNSVIHDPCGSEDVDLIDDYFNKYSSDKNE